MNNTSTNSSLNRQALSNYIGDILLGDIEQQNSFIEEKRYEQMVVDKVNVEHQTKVSSQNPLGISVQFNFGKSQQNTSYS